MSSEPAIKPRKAHALLKSTKEAIAKYKRDNPNCTLVEIARQFGVKESQVRRSIEQSESGELHRKRARQPVARIKKIMSDSDPDKLIDDQVHYSLAALEAANYMTPDERISALQKLVSTRGLIARQKLAAHLKNADAEFVAFLYRKFVRPNLSDDEIVKLYCEDFERWKRDTAE